MNKTRKKWNYTDVKKIFDDNNMLLLSVKYKNMSEKLQYQCLKCLYVGEKMLGNLLAGKGCYSCSGAIKLSIEKVRQLFKEKYLLLLSETYKNNHQKLKYECLNCGFIGEKTVSCAKQSSCPNCYGNIQFKYQEVEKLFADKNLKLLDKEYHNTNQKLRYRCVICGYEDTKKLKHLKSGHGCKKCGWKICGEKQKYTYEEIKSFFAEKKLLLLSTEYTGSSQKLKYRCLLCGFEGEKSLNHLSHSCNWFKMNLTYEDRLNRRNLPEYKQWAKDIKKRDNYTCQKCFKRGGKAGVLNSHHKNAWASFPEQRYLISNGITFCLHCHKSFHQQFGKGKTTEFQIEQFLKQDTIC